MKEEKQKEINRHILNEEDKKVLDELKKQLEKGINTLLKHGIRPTNIEIELHTYIKSLLKED